jgi:hypothetical protein
MKTPAKGEERGAAAAGAESTAAVATTALLVATTVDAAGVDGMLDVPGKRAVARPLPAGGGGGGVGGVAIRRWPEVISGSEWIYRYEETMASVV